MRIGDNTPQVDSAAAAEPAIPVQGQIQIKMLKKVMDNDEQVLEMLKNSLAHLGQNIDIRV